MAAVTRREHKAFFGAFPDQLNILAMLYVNSLVIILSMTSFALKPPNEDNWFTCWNIKTYFYFNNKFFAENIIGEVKNVMRSCM